MGKDGEGWKRRNEVGEGSEAGREREGGRDIWEASGIVRLKGWGGGGGRKRKGTVREVVGRERYRRKKKRE